MSSVYVTNVTHVLNQTEIRCTEIGMTSSTTSSMVTTVNVAMPHSTKYKQYYIILVLTLGHTEARGNKYFVTGPAL